jgi:signal transduction histidine kinase
VFAAVAAALCTGLAVGVWLAVSQYLLLGRERSTLAQTTANAAQVARAASASGLSPTELLSQLPRESGSTSLLVDDGEWFTSSLSIGRDELPAELRETVIDGVPARQRITVDGRPALAIGVPLAGLEDAYFEVFSLEELDDTYQVLAVVLTGGVAAVVPVALLIGAWVTRSTLRPLDRISAAAAAIAGGDLGARIDARDDPSLLSIAGSFNATVSALEDRVRRDARFAADVSHELRSPLTTMLAAVSLVETYAADLPEEGRESLALLHAEVLRFERLVADLLEISKADATTDPAALEDVRLVALVRETVSRRQAGGLGRAPVRVEAEAEDVVVRVDKRRLERVIGNLIDNADKHGGGVRAVRVDLAPTVACVVVDDDGPGVPQEERNRIFAPFARGSGSTRAHTQGAGLGLSLVDRHVRAMGGTVAVTDGPSGGARFVVRLPREEQECAR